MLVLLITAQWSCKRATKVNEKMPEKKISLVQVNPGHFHAALVQKTMYRNIDPLVHVYAPAGPDLDNYLAQIRSYNERTEDPTAWETKIYTGDDYLEKMLSEKAGNLMVTAGNNALKIETIHKAVAAGMNVLADKPMVISAEDFPVLLESFRLAADNGCLLYDIMTERFEITTILQRKLSMIPEVFGTLQEGSPDVPAITKQSVHHLFKYVSGNPIRRPQWYFDVARQGNGLADVGTHLVDLIQWECFPGQIIDYRSDIEVHSAHRWSTVLDKEQFRKVTGAANFPAFLDPYLRQGKLEYPCNGEVVYRIRGIWAKVSVAWKFQAPEGTGDTHHSMMQGSRCNLVIRQGREEGYRPELYVEAVADGDSLGAALDRAFDRDIAPEYPGVKVQPLEQGRWKVVIPDSLRVGHEAHFAQVMKHFLDYMQHGTMPEWEVPDMIAKYYTTTKAVELSVQDR